MRDFKTNSIISKEEFFQRMRLAYGTYEPENVPDEALETLYDNFRLTPMIDLDDLHNRTCICKDFEDYVAWCKKNNQIMPLQKEESDSVIESSKRIGCSVFFEEPDLQKAESNFEILRFSCDCFVFSKMPFVACFGHDKLLTSNVEDSEQILFRLLQVAEKTNTFLKLDSLKTDCKTGKEMVLRNNFVPSDRRMDAKFEKQMEQIKEIIDKATAEKPKEFTWLTIINTILLVVTIVLLVLVLQQA